MSGRTGAQMQARVAVLVDCDNTTPDVLEFALRVVAQFGRVVLRRGYGNHATLAHKWQAAVFDDRADTFCRVSSDSDFTSLCRKLRERGATVHIVGEAKTPDALRNASDPFLEWVKPVSTPEPEAAQPAPKRWPLMVVEVAAVKPMAADTAEGKVHLDPLGHNLKRTDPAFSPQTYGHSGLLDRLRTYDLLAVQQEAGNCWTVRLAPPAEAAAAASHLTALNPD